MQDNLFNGKYIGSNNESGVSNPNFTKIAEAYGFKTFKFEDNIQLENNIDEVLNAYVEAPKKGLNVEINGKSIFEWSKIFLNISKEGLISRNNINLKKNDETVYLKNIENILRTKKTKAQETLDNLK